MDKGQDRRGGLVGIFVCAVLGVLLLGRRCNNAEIIDEAGPILQSVQEIFLELIGGLCACVCRTAKAGVDA